jgi:hypothetical protein
MQQSRKLRMKNTTKMEYKERAEEVKIMQEGEEQQCRHEIEPKMEAADLRHEKIDSRR